MDDGWLSLTEVAAQLGLHYRSVWQMARRGELPAERDEHAPGRPYRVRPRDLDAFLERSRVRPGQVKAAPPRLSPSPPGDRR